MLPKILICAGVRPNFVKIAPIIRELNTCADKLEYQILHTGQHYASNMSDTFFDVLNIRKPDFYFSGNTETPAEKISYLVRQVATTCIEIKPDLVLVVGDVDSTLACAIAATKSGIPVAHIESGERSYDRTMQEEINRICVDNLSRYLFCSTGNAMRNLALENIRSGVFLSGNVMVDNLIWALSALTKPAYAGGKYAVATIHRAINTDRRYNLENILEGLFAVAENRTVFFPVHPRTKLKMKEYGLTINHKNIVELEPTSYFEFLSLVRYADVVITDSGGLQVEAAVFKTPCVTVRESTEHMDTIKSGANILSNIYDIEENVIFMLRKNITYPYLGDGKASVRIVKKLAEVLK